MPLFYIAARAPTGDFFSVGYCFLSGETAQDYSWAIQAWLSSCCQGIKRPNVVITDDCKALHKALDHVLPTVPRLLCRFHVFRAVDARIHSIFNRASGENNEAQHALSAQARTRFLTCIYASTVDDYHQAITQLDTWCTENEASGQLK